MSGSGCASFCSVFQTLRHSAAPWMSSGALICFSKSGFVILWDGGAVPIRATWVHHNDCSRGVSLTRCPLNSFSFGAVSVSGDLRCWEPGGAQPCVRWPHFLEEAESKWVSLSFVFPPNVFLPVERGGVWSFSCPHTLTVAALFA